MTEYEKFIQSKTQLGGKYGFDPIWMPDDNFEFQNYLCDWVIKAGRGLILADCGMGKSRMLLTFARNIELKYNKPILILTPIAVGFQMVVEAEKIGVDVERSNDGKFTKKIVITNYERLHYFNRNDFIAVIADESSILKNFDGSTRVAVTDFMRKMQYRLLTTATAAPNDYIELGTSSEALGELGFVDMVNRFFKKTKATAKRSDEFKDGLYQFRGHAEKDFWRWVCSWSRAIRKPSDYGFSDIGFDLPKLTINETVVSADKLMDGYLLPVPAIGLKEQRTERSNSVESRCESAASFANDSNDSCVCWCHLNREGDLITKLTENSAQVSGSDEIEKKEEIFMAFQSGQIKTIVTKPTVAGFGLNWQHCHRQTFFPSHSFEQFYQSIRRCWRFGQKDDVIVNMILTDGDLDVIRNLRTKQHKSEEMFQRIIEMMQNELSIKNTERFNEKISLPSWM